MERLEGRVAVVTGGGTGMGRELVALLAAEGCHVAACDVDEDALAETRRRALADARPGVRVVTGRADVASEADLVAFAELVTREFATGHVNLVFNNAGIGGGGSVIDVDRAEWERTFNVDWGGVYLGTRVFLPLLLGADEGHLVNTSSINGLWASLGPHTPHTAYSAAKFAVRGFTEALITDLALNAPHVRVSLVMPGHVGTSIVINSGKILGREPESLGAEDLTRLRRQLNRRGLDADAVSDEDLRKGVRMMGEAFRDSAPLSARDAARIILDGVRANRWRILVGEDARIVDEEVRRDPEHVYDETFFDALRQRGLFGGLGG